MNKIHAALDEAISKKDPKLACYLVQAELTNPNNSYAEALDALEYIEEKFPQAVVAYDTFPRDINPNSKAWTDDYFYEQSNCLSYNFSRKRFEHLVEIAKHLEQQGHDLFQKSVSEQSTNLPIRTTVTQKSSKHPAPPTPSLSDKPDMPWQWIFLGIAILLALLILIF